MVSQLALIVAIAESVGEGLIAVDLEGQPTFLNHMASRALGLRVDKLPTGSELPVDMVAPLRQILGGTALVSDSDSQFALPDERTLEVAYLAKPLMIHGKLAGAMMAFRDIAAAKGAQRILQQRNHFFEMSQEVFCIADPVTGRFLQVNPAYAKLLGFAEAEMLAIPFIDLLHPLDKAPTQEAIERQMSGAETINGLLTRMRCADDSYRWLEWVSITASDGLLYGAARDVTARREADIALAKAMDDLRIRNRELQDFAYVASHDLQEPLRKIQSFSDRLQSRLGSSLDDSSHDYLRRMGQAALRMQTLIDDLLAYSRVATRTAGVAPVDLAAVLAAVLDDLEARIAEAKAVVTFDPLPTIQADATQMRQLLQNLLANALKFRDAERPCVVAISVRRTGAVFELRVSDNGIGFEPAYAERIFAPFQRLHPRNVYEGTGIGLAIVRRIVERHGGTIRAESDAGQGASFIVTLPVMSGERLSAGRDASSIDGEILGADS
jgi:PAS domain S-box-containing protein